MSIYDFPTLGSSFFCVSVCFDLLGQARLQPRPELGVPIGVPVTKSLHVVRDGKVDRVCKILDSDGVPAVAALAGRSGAGKTTSAAAMVGERGDRVRALFPRGVVWLPVGKGEGAADRLPSLMHRLAKKFHEDVMKEDVDAPAVGENGERYVKKIVSQESIHCLVVADDVWEGSVVQKLRQTGMWVILTTRVPEMVKPNERVAMNTLTDTEAEDVLRGAAELPPGERLCDAAMKVLGICGRVAMDVAFVGSWIRHVETKRKEDAWARAVESIKAQGGGVDAERDDNRLAILQAGFKYLGTENVLAQQLYAELTVFPDGHAFEESDAAVLLGDGEVATKPISVLERWGVLRTDASGKHRMHDAHVGFARGKLMRWEDVREPAVERWTAHISRLEFAVGMDVYLLLRMWRALEEVGGDGWWVSRPYDDQLVGMSASDSSKNHSLNVVAELYEQGGMLPELETLMRDVLEGVDGDGENDVTVKMTALWYLLRSIVIQGRFTEYEPVTSRLGRLYDSIVKPMPNDGGHAHCSTTFNAYGVGAAAAEHHEDSAGWFRKALKAQEDVGLGASLQTVATLLELGRCLRKSGLSEEAERTLKRALEIKAKGPDDLQVAWVLQELGQSVLMAGRLGEAEVLFKRMLTVVETKKGADDPWAAVALEHLGECLRKAGRPGEAEAFSKRALEIKRVKPGPGFFMLP